MKWKPIYTDSKKKFEVINRVQEIADAILGFKTNHHGLMGGEIGKALLYFYVGSYTKNEKYFDAGSAIIEDASRHVGQITKSGGKFSNGISGFGWLIQHLETEKLIDSDTEEFLASLDLHNQPLLDFYLTEQNFDYLHGALGIGLYYISRLEHEENQIQKTQIEKIIISLDKNVSWKDDCCYWYSFDFTNEVSYDKTINLGLAHGMPSTILFLLQAAKHGIQPELCEKLIYGSINTFRSCKADPSINNCYYPNSIQSGNAKFPSRLAWCYGDLGIAYSILLSGIHFADKNLITEAEEIFSFQCSRRDFSQNLIWDAGFCHGTSGVGFMFQKAYSLTSHEYLKDAANFWYSATEKMRNYPDGLNGFKSYTGQIRRTYEPDAGLLEGVSGIGLCLLASISENPQNWPKAFLLY